MRIVVTGRYGQLAQALYERGSIRAHEVVRIGRPSFDLATPATIPSAIKDARPDVIVASAAYTTVDRAEIEKELAFLINAAGATRIAEVAAQIKVPIIYISTDYVFDGLKATSYTEVDPTNPISVYGKTKLSGEQGVIGAIDNHVILRVSWVYSPFGTNFMKTMLRIAEVREDVSVVLDQIGCPTSAFDIADTILVIAEQIFANSAAHLRGAFHLSPKGEASWAEFAEVIFAKSRSRGGRGCIVRHVETKDYPAAARRPPNSRLNSAKIRQVYGIEIPDWRYGLDDCLDRLMSPTDKYHFVKTKDL